MSPDPKVKKSLRNAVGSSRESRRQALWRDAGAAYRLWSAGSGPTLYQGGCRAPKTVSFDGASFRSRQLGGRPRAEGPRAEGRRRIGPGPVKGTEELWFLLTALDTLIFCLAIAVIKDEAVIVQARREVQPYSSQLSDPKAEEAFNAALKSSDGQARIEQNKTAINDAAKEIDALLTDVVSPPVRASVVRAFARSSTLLVARAAENQSWWCRVYAFRKVRC